MKPTQEDLHGQKKKEFKIHHAVNRREGVVNDFNL